MIASSVHKGWIGADIGTHSIKMAQLRQRRGEYELLSASIASRQEPWQPGDAMRDLPTESQAELRAAFQSGQYQGRTTATCTSMAICEYQMMIAGEAPATSFHQQVVDEFGIRHSGVSFEFGTWSLPVTSPEGEDTAVLAMPTRWAEQLTKDCSQAGLYLQAIDATPLALASAMKLGDQTRQPIAAIDWGYTQATIVGLYQGEVYFVRSLPDCGLNRWIEELGRALSITRLEAEVLLRSHALPDEANHEHPLARMVQQWTIDPMRELLEQLVRTLSFLRIRYSSAIPTQVYLFGGGATTDGLDELLSHRLEIPCRRWQLQGVSSSVPGDEHCLYGAAIGCSMMAWEQSKQ